MKKYASDFVRMIEDQKKNYSAPDYLDLLNELETELSHLITESMEQLELETPE
jgi:hypothetical protein